MVECVEVKGADLAELLLRARAGEELVICEAGQPVAKLVAAGSRPGRRQLGSAKGLFEVPDSFFEPLPDDLVEPSAAAGAGTTVRQQAAPEDSSYRLGGASERDWQRRLDELNRMIDQDFAGREMPDPAEEIRRGREERDQAIEDAILGLP